MAFTLVQSSEEGLSATATTIVTPSIAVTAGNLLVAWVKHESDATTITPSGGGNTWQSLTKTTHGNSDTHGQWFYVLAAASGTYGFTGTFGATKPFRSAILFEFSYDGTASFDVEAGASGTTSSSPETISSGDITTTGEASIAVCGYAEYSSDTLSSQSINGQAADGVVTVTGGENFTSAWHTAFSATYTGAGTASMPTSTQAWILRVASFTDTAAGGGGSVRRSRMLVMGAG